MKVTGLKGSGRSWAARGAWLIGGLVGGLVGQGCDTPEPQPPPPPPPAPVEKPKPPPPPPKCEALKENCEADGETRVPVPGAGLSFKPPKGWIYAKLEEATVAQQGDEGAVLVLASFQPEAGFKVGKQRNDLAQSLAELVLVEPSGAISLFAPNMTRDFGGLKMKLWEKGGAKRGGDTGGMLILSASLGERELFGVGFAPKDDQDGTAASLAMLETLSAEDGGKDEGEGDEGDVK